MRNCRLHVLAIVLAIAPARLGLAADPLGSGKPAPAEYRRPELVALTWQQSTKAGAETKIGPVWRPDGSLLDDAEVEWLRKDLKTLSGFSRGSGNELRPLVMVFRIDERAKSTQSLMGSVAVNGQFRPCGTTFNSTPSFLAKTVIIPNRGDLAAWPAEVDIEIKAPVGEPELVKFFNEPPAGHFQVDEGVRWYVDRIRGIRTDNGRRQSGFPAAVFEIDARQADPLCSYFASVRLKDGQSLREDYVTMADAEGTVTVRVSQVLDEKNPVASAEFTRRRHRLERYEKLPTRLDLKPPENIPDVPAVPAFRLR